MIIDDNIRYSHSYIITTKESGVRSQNERTGETNRSQHERTVYRLEIF